jgi:hypothetical protein
MQLWNSGAISSAPQKILHRLCSLKDENSFYFINLNFRTEVFPEGATHIATRFGLALAGRLVVVEFVEVVHQLR